MFVAKNATYTCKYPLSLNLGKHSGTVDDEEAEWIDESEDKKFKIR